MIRKCTCQNEAQDKLHGEGNRVWNPCKGKSAGMQGWRCTVCQAVIELAK